MFDWSDEKDSLLRRERGVSFQDVIYHISQGDVLALSDHPNVEKKANRYGMPYQTLVSSVLHRYVAGDLTEVDS
ncbi:MAG: hypothetical protein CML13_11320 [Puniceicoccaceae bacterium]|nr:hypothetical protein [Puniceicoccaceae bacterium]